jgi:uncharacterized C2H2 Zn-finger protein
MREKDLADYLPPSFEDGFALFEGLCERCDALVKANMMFALIFTLCEPCVGVFFDPRDRDAERFALCAECDALVKDRVAEHHLAATNCDHCKVPLAVAQLPITTYIVTNSRQRKPWWFEEPTI